MSLEHTDDCQACRPAIIDIKTGQVFPPDAPEMVGIAKIWEEASPEERRAFHNMTINNSSDPKDLELCGAIIDKVKEVTAAPKRISDRTLTIDITDYIFPWANSQPMLLNMPGTYDLFLPIFSTPEKLLAFADDSKIPYESVKKIDDAYDFLVSLPEGVRVIVDVYRHENGKIRFTEIQTTKTPM